MKLISKREKCLIISAALRVSPTTDCVDNFTFFIFEIDLQRRALVYSTCYIIYVYFAFLPFPSFSLLRSPRVSVPRSSKKLNSMPCYLRNCIKYGKTFFVLYWWLINATTAVRKWGKNNMYLLFTFIYIVSYFNIIMQCQKEIFIHFSSLLPSNLHVSALRTLISDVVFVIFSHFSPVLSLCISLRGSLNFICVVSVAFFPFFYSHLL